MTIEELNPSGSSLFVLTTLISDGFVQLGPSETELGLLLADLQSGRTIDRDTVDRLEAKADLFAERHQSALDMLRCLEDECIRPAVPDADVPSGIDSAGQPVSEPRMIIPASIRPRVSMAFLVVGCLLVLAAILAALL